MHSSRLPLRLKLVNCAVIPGSFFQVNHAGRREEANAEWGCDWERNQIFLIATENIRPGEEILASYGDKPNLSWLLYYGFVPEGNDADACPLFESSEAAQQWVTERSNEPPLTSDSALSIGLQGAADFDMVQAICEQAQCSDVVAGRYLQERANQILAWLPTLYEEDSEHLESLDDGPMRDVLRFRMKRKAILREFVALPI